MKVGASKGFIRVDLKKIMAGGGFRATRKPPWIRMAGEGFPGNQKTPLG